MALVQNWVKLARLRITQTGDQLQNYSDRRLAAELLGPATSCGVTQTGDQLQNYSDWRPASEEATASDVPMSCGSCDISLPVGPVTSSYTLGPVTSSYTLGLVASACRVERQTVGNRAVCVC